MRTLLLIHSYPGATETLKLLWSGFKVLGWDIVGVETIDGEHEWPEPVNTIKIGLNKYWTQDRRNLARRFTGSLRYFLSTDYDRVCILEYDTLVLGPVNLPETGIVTHRAGGQLPDSQAPEFFHTPWMFDRESARTVELMGQQLIMDGTVDYGCHGSPDILLGLIVNRLNLPWRESGTFSANTINGEYVEKARVARRSGCVLFHGVKTKEQMQSVLSDT